MHLKLLLQEITGYQLQGSADIWLTGISAHSKQIAPGNLFIAKKGGRQDGKQFAREAVQFGASAVVLDTFDPSLGEICQIVHPNPVAIEADLAAAFFHHPANELFMTGITGTNGKTTTAFILKYLLDQVLGPCGLIGTIEYILGSIRLPAAYTTPEAITNQRILRDMCQQGCRSAVMEVSSHGLDQGRVDRIDYDAAIFTNLTLDHLDYHGSMDRYCAAKNRLFRMLGQDRRGKGGDKWAIVNQDSSWTPRIMEGCCANVLTYGIEGSADVQAVDVHFSEDGTHASICYKGEKVACNWPLVGKFNVYNCLGAMSVLLAKEIPLKEIASLMHLIPPVRGRLERVKNALGLNIYVDFAHTDDALRKVLETLRGVNKGGRLIVVFGCGGDRDPTKRPKMAQACEEFADYCIVTSDNPRSESPLAICEETARGFVKPGSYSIEVDRRAAIQLAIQMAGSEDVVLIAGKGHETKQIFAQETIIFDDYQMAAECCAMKRFL